MLNSFQVIIAKHVCEHDKYNKCMGHTIDGVDGIHQMFWQEIPKTKGFGGLVRFLLIKGMICCTCGRFGYLGYVS